MPVDQEGKHRGHRSLAGIDASVAAREDEHAAPIDADRARGAGLWGDINIICTAMRYPRLRSVDALDQTVVRLEGVRAAGDAIPGWPRRYLHAGPPVGLDELPGPMCGALLGALVFEGEAGTRSGGGAPRLGRGRARALPRRIAASALWPGREPADARRGRGLGRAARVRPLNEGLGRALRFGSYDEARSPASSGWQAWRAGTRSRDRGDRAHRADRDGRRGPAPRGRVPQPQRRDHRGARGRLAPASPRPPGGEAAECSPTRFENRHFFLPSRSRREAARGRRAWCAAQPRRHRDVGNGRRLGIRVSGLGTSGSRRWRRSATPLLRRLRRHEATPMMGDSFITESRAGAPGADRRSRDHLVHRRDVESAPHLIAEMR